MHWLKIQKDDILVLFLTLPEMCQVFYQRNVCFKFLVENLYQIKEFPFYSWVTKNIPALLIRILFVFALVCFRFGCWVFIKSFVLTC